MEMDCLIVKGLKEKYPLSKPIPSSLSKKYTSGVLKEVQVALNSGMYKNAFTCGIPNSSHIGNIFSAALGYVAGKPEMGLEALSDVTEEEAESVIVDAFLD